MILFKNVTKKFALGKKVVSNLNFEINSGEFVFIVGPSGAGKTTILRLISSQILPTAGKIEIGGTKINPKGLKDKLKLRKRIGFVFQDFKILPYKNVFENIALGLSIKGTSDKKIKDEVNTALRFVSLEEKGLFFPLQLSAGELQRVAIARAIAGDREIILADEPTGNLDPKTMWTIMKIFKDLEGKRTIVMATHNIDIVNSLKKRVIAIEKGSIVSDEKQSQYKF